MAQLPPFGNRHDFYAANGLIDFAYLPGGLASFAPNDTPIRLQRGDVSFGAFHIVKEHGHWLDIHKLDVAEMVWLKLQGNGKVFTTEDTDKLKINLFLNPKALLVLRYIEKSIPFFTVVTMYALDRGADGAEVGHYPGNGLREIPKLSLPAPKSVPIVTIKKKRSILPSAP